MIQPRDSMGSITSSISKCDAMFTAFPCSYMRATHLVVERAAFGGVRLRLELLAVSELHRALEPHSRRTRPVGQETVKNGALNEPPAIACAPSP